MKLELLKPNNTKLKSICTEVTDFDNKEYLDIIEQIKEICLREKAYASAAPQFGILKRFILVMTEEEIKAKNSIDLHTRKINYNITPYFNPRITSMKGKQYFWESCMSVYNTMGKVIRPYHIELEAQDINGNYFTKSADGFEAIILCHEIDHLDGIEYTDKAEEILYDIDENERMAYRQDHPHTIISKDCDFNQDDI